MRRYLLSVMLLLCSVAPLSAQPTPLFDSALAQVGLTAEQVRFDQDEMALWQGDKYRMDYFTMFHKNPFKLPKYGELFVPNLKDNLGNPTSIVQTATRLMDQPVRRGLIGDPLSEWTQYPDSAPKHSMTSTRNLLVGDQYKWLRRQVDLIWRMVDDDRFALKQALDEVGQAKHRRKLFDYFVRDSVVYDDEVERLAAMVDRGLIAAATQDLVEAARRIMDSAAASAFPSYLYEIKTRKGLIAIGTAGDDRFAYIEPPLLIIDGGGNDSYSWSGANSDYPLTLVIDGAGNDTYVSTDSTQAGIGGGLASVAIICDKSGNDRYQVEHVGLGCGILGAGVLIDMGGNDTYKGRLWTEAAGAFGVGVLSDSAGTDSLYCWSKSQGYGYTQGCGLLVNGDGNDVYIAEDSFLFDPASQTKDHNNSSAQGVGFGKRADIVDGDSWAGGVGLLCDLSGNDRYSAGLFAQGCAYWFAVGMLLDASGNDIYDGIWYVQGSGAHFGVGYLDDQDGDDQYTATMNMAIGAGHDFTIGFLLDRAGNDRYTAPNLSLGGGNSNGIGLFCDLDGDDHYSTRGGTTLGRANSVAGGPRERLGVWGIFVDAAGNDQYSEPWAGNGKRWIGPASDTTKVNPMAIGVGVDN